jgi:hypothetical protein
VGLCPRNAQPRLPGLPGSQTLSTDSALLTRMWFWGFQNLPSHSHRHQRLCLSAKADPLRNPGVG